MGDTNGTDTQPPELSLVGNGPRAEGELIHRSMVAIINDLPAIGKNRENREQHFNFRGVDDVIDALKPLLARHGVYYMPSTLERVVEKRTTRSNATMHTVHLHVEFTFYAVDGSYVTADVWGEGTDMGDKSTSKAHTLAQKACLFEAFNIATNDVDPDEETPEETAAPTNQPPKAAAKKAGAAKKTGAQKAPQGAHSDVDADAVAAGWESEDQRRSIHAELKEKLQGLGDIGRGLWEGKPAWPLSMDQYNDFLEAVIAAQAPEDEGEFSDPVGAGEQLSEEDLEIPAQEAPLPAKKAAATKKAPARPSA